MGYKALQSVRFDRLYLIGEEIPSRVILSNRVADLISMGLIEKTESEVSSELDVSAVVNSVDKRVEEKSVESADVKIENPVDGGRAELTSKTKVELMEIAASKNIALEGNMTKAQLIDAILSIN